MCIRDRRIIQAQLEPAIEPPRGDGGEGVEFVCRRSLNHVFIPGRSLCANAHLPRDSLARLAYEKTYGGMMGLAVAQDSYPVRLRGRLAEDTG